MTWYTKGQAEAQLVVSLGCLFLWLAMVAAWVTHIVFCITHAAWLLLIAGALVFPVGVIHGISIWLGLGWVQ